MKKLSLLLVFSFAFLFSAIAQDNQTTSSKVEKNKKEKYTTDEDSVSNNGKNWFIGAGVQGDVYLNNQAKADFGGVLARPSLAGNVFVGKWFSHKVGARLFVEGGTLHPFFEIKNKRDWMEDEKYLGGRVDFMLNLTNCFRSFSPDRFYNLVLYLGPGYEQSFNAPAYPNSGYRPDHESGSGSFMVGGGVLNTFRLSNHVSLFANVGLNVADAKADGYKDNSPSLFGSPNYFDGILSGSIGLIYNFGKTAKKEIVAPPIVQEAPKYALTIVNGTGSGTYVAGTVVNIAANCASGTQTFDGWTGNDVSNVANANNASTTFTMGNSNATITAMCKNLPPKVVEQPAPVPVPATLDPVFFRLDKSVIDPDQESKVKAAADFLNSNPNAKLSVVGYADAQTANPKYNMALSQRRTKAVAKALVTKYKVDSSRLILDWKGDTVAPFPATVVRTDKETKETSGSNEKNRVVMFVK